MNAVAALPPGVRPYRTTPTFTEDSVPAGLTGRHATKDGVWGAITVESGRLWLHRLDGAAAPELLLPGVPGIVAPQEPHRVQPEGAVAFHVVFHRA